MKPYLESLLLIAAIILGSLTGLYTSFESSMTDFFIIAMLFLLFYNISLADFFKGVGNRKYISLALLSNFIGLPVLAFVLSYVFADSSNAIFMGLIIYLVAPCTDWFLGFTKLANGDVEVNSALLPFNLLMQILLLPVYLFLFTANSIIVPVDALLEVFIYWVLLPFAFAQFIRYVISKINSEFLAKSSQPVETLVLIAIVMLVFSIFNSNIASLLENTELLPRILVVILIFFITSFFIARLVARLAAMSKKEEISLTMTTAARNSPLMLVVSLVFFPQEPLIHLVLVIGMLVEFPHLITITYLLKRQSPVRFDGSRPTS